MLAKTKQGTRQQPDLLCQRGTPHAHTGTRSTAIHHTTTRNHTGHVKGATGPYHHSLAPAFECKVAGHSSPQMGGS